MRSRKAKVLHTITGKPLLWHVLSAVWGAGIEDVCVVVGFQAEAVRKTIGTVAARRGVRRSVRWVAQSEQLGTAHALLMAAPLFGIGAGSGTRPHGAESVFGGTKKVLVICGDVPFVRPHTIRQLFDAHVASRAACTVLTVCLEEPANYGRIVRGPNGDIKAIVEAHDADAEQEKIEEVNSGIYVFQAPLVFDALREVRCCNVKHEYYLTDVVAILSRRGAPVVPFSACDAREVLGINDRTELAAARRLAGEQYGGLEDTGVRRGS